MNQPLGRLFRDFSIALVKNCYLAVEQFHYTPPLEADFALLEIDFQGRKLGVGLVPLDPNLIWGDVAASTTSVF